MRYLILSTAMTGILLAGCSTFPSNPAETRAFLQKNESTIKAAVQFVRLTAVRYIAKNPDERAQINGQIDVVATQVGFLLARGDFDPDSVTAALKVKEPYVAEALSALALLYSASYDSLQQRDQAQLAIILLRDIADGLAPRLPPPEGLVK